MNLYLITYRPHAYDKPIPIKVAANNEYEAKEKFIARGYEWGKETKIDLFDPEKGELIG